MSHDLLDSLLVETAQTGNDVEDAQLPDGEEGLKEPLHEEDEADLDALEEAALLEFAQSQEILSEQMNIVRLNRQTRLLNLSNRTALIMARRANDSLYDKYAKFNALRLQFRAQIVKKYGSKAASYARKLMTQTSTASGAKK